jgi:DNA repair photolyase
MSLVELLSRWTPARVIVQTRSPLLAIALPALRALGNRLWVSVALETLDESVIRTYTPGLPSGQERLKLLRTLKRFGIRTGVQIGPVLPYGEWMADAAGFVDTVLQEADYVTLHSVGEMAERLGRGSAEARIAARLADERRFHWLRRDAVRPLATRLDERGEECLVGGIEMTRLPERQLGLFDQG